MLKRIVFPVLVLLVSLPVAAQAGDLDDGISKFTEDSISSNDQLGQVDNNINFIKLNAKSQAEVRSKKGKDQAEDPQSGGRPVPRAGVETSIAFSSVQGPISKALS